MSPTLEDQQARERDWDEPVETGNSLYLRLASKGDSCRIRIVGKPIQYVKTFEDQATGETKRSTKYAVKVIYRNQATKTNEIKGFEMGTQIIKAIQDLHQNEDWGNPENYDVEITRTEEKGKYYSIIPKPPKPLTEEEKELVLTTDLDLFKLYCGVDKQEDDPFKD